jgi:hypothetical protein
MKALRKWLLAGLGAFALGSCTEVGTLATQRMGVSIMILNLRDAYNVPSSNAGVLWRVRYRRAVDWMVAQPSPPDVIALTEAPAWYRCDSRPFIHDYEAIQFLIEGIRARTNVEYRIAYLLSADLSDPSSGDAWIGSIRANRCSARSGRALLYRVDKLRNVQRQSGFAFNDEENTGTHLLNSVPCCNPAPREMSVCGLVDGPVVPATGCAAEVHAGAAWTRRQTATARSLDAVFSRLEVLAEPGKFIHIYNVHLVYNNNQREPGVEAIKTLVTDTERRFSSPTTDRLYPPVMLGDFNIDASIVADYFPGFSQKHWSGEVMGMLIGNPQNFPATQNAYVNDFQILPPGGCASIPPPAAGDPDGELQDPAILWSDHCASIFLRIEPTRL